MGKIQYILLLLVFCLSFNNKLTAQKTASYFQLSGNVNTDTGTALLLRMEDGYYPGEEVPLTTTIHEGKFSFQAPCLYPIPFRLMIKVTPDLIYVSDYFMVETGNQHITCDVHHMREVPLLSNKSTAEWETQLRRKFAPVNVALEELSQQYDSVRKMIGKPSEEIIAANFQRQEDSLIALKRSILQHYIKLHPDSYVAMWELILQLRRGYATPFTDMYGQFSKQVQRSHTGVVLKEKLEQAKRIAIGAKFPLLALSDTNLIPVKGPTIAGKYTLVDFWYSHCSPCIGQFGELKKLYERYNNSGFSIIGISVDHKSMIKDWKEVMVKYQLPWKQYLDQDALNADMLSIPGYPTNFLLDAEGRIMRRDIDLGELDKLLRSKL